MYNVSYIRDYLKKYIDQKADRFIIYPFGENGLRVKNILKDYFDREPCFVVDNEISNYHPGIISKEKLRDLYQPDMYVILTLENTMLNGQLEKELLEFVPEAKIINLQNNEIRKNDSGNYIGQGFFLRDFLPEYTIEKKRSDKIKVRIVHRSPTIWNVISTICKAFAEDSMFDLLLLIHDDWIYEQSVEQVKEAGYKYVLWKDYHGETDQPDILILTGNLKKRVSGIIQSRLYAKLVVVAAFSLIRYTDTIEEYWHYHIRGTGVFRPDYYLFDSLQYKEIKRSGIYSQNVIEMGNAKFDGIWHAIQEREYCGRWRKLKGKRTVLWVTSHDMDGNHCVGRGMTFDLYAKTIFDYARMNPEMGFIFRPHTGFIEDMLTCGFWSEEEFMIFKRYCDSSSNIVFDDTDTYDKAFSLADGVLTDAYCGVIITALPTLKPICAAYRSKRDISLYPEVTDCYYSAYESGDIIYFFDLIKNSQDPMLKLRKEASEKYIKHFDGKNGFRIKEFIREKYLEKMEEANLYERKY